MRCCAGFVRLIRLGGTVLVLLLGVAVSTAHQAIAEEILFKETFETEPGAGWIWVRQKDGAWRIRDGGLEFRIAGKDNILARKVPVAEGPFAVEVTLKASNPTPVLPLKDSRVRP